LVFGVLSYLTAFVPVVVLLLSPRPGIGGWMFFGLLALGFASIATAYMAHVLSANVSIQGSKLRYHEPWRSVEVDLAKVKNVYASLNYIVLDTGEPRRIAIPDVFERREELLNAIAKRNSA
jgi:hypothetical protein